jgi:hypothetical protein
MSGVGQADDGGGDEDFSLFERRCDDRGGVGWNRDLEGEEAACRIGEGGGGAAVGPAAAEGDVDAEAESAAFGLCVVDGVEHGGGEEGEILQVLGGIGWIMRVEDFGVDEG